LGPSTTLAAFSDFTSPHAALFIHYSPSKFPISFRLVGTSLSIMLGPIRLEVAISQEIVLLLCGINNLRAFTLITQQFLCRQPSVPSIFPGLCPHISTFQGFLRSFGLRVVLQSAVLVLEVRRYCFAFFAETWLLCRISKSKDSKEDEPDQQRSGGRQGRILGGKFFANESGCS